MEITALTRVGALLEAHPELESKLADFAPAFARLRNPVLRATVGKFATLEQAARVGGVPLPDLVAFLRRSLGQGEGDPGASGIFPAGPGIWPPWFDPAAVFAELDAGRLLAEGGHPLAAVRKALAGGPPGAILLLRSDFEPAPLLEQVAKEGILSACLRERNEYVTCLRRA